MRFSPFKPVHHRRQLHGPVTDSSLPDIETDPPDAIRQSDMFPSRWIEDNRGLTVDCGQREIGSLRTCRLGRDGQNGGVDRPIEDNPRGERRYARILVKTSAPILRGPLFPAIRRPDVSDAVQEALPPPFDHNPRGGGAIPKPMQTHRNPAAIWRPAPSLVQPANGEERSSVLRAEAGEDAGCEQPSPFFPIPRGSKGLGVKISPGGCPLCLVGIREASVSPSTMGTAKHGSDLIPLPVDTGMERSRNIL